MKKIAFFAVLAAATAAAADDFPKPYSAPCVERPPLRRDLAPGAPGARAPGKLSWTDGSATSSSI